MCRARVRADAHRMDATTPYGEVLHAIARDELSRTDASVGQKEQEFEHDTLADT